MFISALLNKAKSALHRNEYGDREIYKKTIDAKTILPSLWNQIYKKHGLLENIGTKSETKSETKNETKNETKSDTSTPSLDSYIKKIHQVVGNYTVREGDLILYGNSANHLIYAIVHILSNLVGRENLVVIEQSPYCEAHRSVVIQEQVEWFVADEAEAEDVKDKFVIEIVTSPNNPDGRYRNPVNNIFPHVIIADLIQDWPWLIDHQKEEDLLLHNQSWMDEYRDKGGLLFPIFSLSNAFGVSGEKSSYVFWPTDHRWRKVGGMQWIDDTWTFSWVEREDDIEDERRKDKRRKDDTRDIVWLANIEGRWLLQQAEEYFSVTMDPIDSHIQMTASESICRLFVDEDVRLLRSIEEVESILIERRKILDKVLEDHVFIRRIGYGLGHYWGKFDDDEIDSEKYFKEKFNAIVRGGKENAADRSYACINMFLSFEDFEEFVERIEYGLVTLDK